MRYMLLIYSDEQAGRTASTRAAKLASRRPARGDNGKCINSLLRRRLTVASYPGSTMSPAAAVSLLRDTV